MRGEALIVAKAALPSRTPPGHAKKSREIIQTLLFDHAKKSREIIQTLLFDHAEKSVVIKQVKCQNTRISSPYEREAFWYFYMHFMLDTRRDSWIFTRGVCRGGWRSPLCRVFYIFKYTQGLRAPALIERNVNVN